MDGFVVSRGVTQMVTAACGERAARPERDKPWLKWSLEKRYVLPCFFCFLFSLPFRNAVAKQYNETKSYKMLKLRFGNGCPPSSTVRSWSQAVQLGRQVLQRGKPTNLTAAEEDNVIAAARMLRGKGALQSLSLSSLCSHLPNRSRCRSRSSHLVGHIGHEACAQLAAWNRARALKVLGYIIQAQAPDVQAAAVHD